MSDTGPLSREDYEEPCCPLDMRTPDEAAVRRIPLARVLEKLDEHLSRRDTAAAERLLRYWLEEARAGRDGRGELALSNEMMGLMRKSERREEALAAGERALALLAELDLADSVTAGTTYVNYATVCKTFGMAAEALPYFEKAGFLYEKHLPGGDGRLGGLRNNMGLALADLGRFEEARRSFREALDIMASVPGGELEQAVTWLNLADLAEAELGSEEAEDEILQDLAKARQLLDAPALPRDGYYAFVAEKCAPGFRYYGDFAEAKKLEEEARRIYERT